MAYGCIINRSIKVMLTTNEWGFYTNSYSKDVLEKVTENINFFVTKYINLNPDNPRSAWELCVETLDFHKMYGANSTESKNALHTLFTQFYPNYR